MKDLDPEDGVGLGGLSSVKWWAFTKERERVLAVKGRDGLELLGVDLRGRFGCDERWA